jgi:hypothetical protein
MSPSSNSPEKKDRQIQELKQHVQTILNKVNKKESIWAFRWYILGFIVLFLSWILQNHLLARWNGKLEKLDWKRGLAISNDIKVEVAELSFRLFGANYDRDTSNTALRNSYIDGLASFCVVVLGGRGTAADMMADANSQYQDTFELRKKEYSQGRANIQSALEKRDLAYLNELTNQLHSPIYARQKDESILLVNRYRAKLIRKRDTANDIFLISYFVGSALVAIAFILRNIEKFKSRKK